MNPENRSSVSNRSAPVASRATLGAVSILLIGVAVLSGRIAAVAPRGVERAPGGGSFDHSSYDALLKKYVDDEGLVAYRSWKEKDLKALEEYLQEISRTDPEKLGSKEERLAFWINTYNALTIRGIMQFYPLESIKDKVSRFFGYNIWKDYQIEIAGRERSLDDIEHGILRKMGEPRIHFALVCASIGCPKLQRDAYTGKELDAQLHRSARQFLNDPKKNLVNGKEGTAYLSRIFDWFQEDFGGTERSVLRFVAPYRPEKDRALLRKSSTALEYLDYDWSLNDQKE